MRRQQGIVLILFLILVSPITSLPLYSQNNSWNLVKSISTSVQKVSIDPYFNFYTADKNGNVFKYDSLGNQLLGFSPSKKADVTLLEAWRTLNIFIFYRDLQEYNILDRFLTTSNGNYSFTPEGDLIERNIGFARLATLAADNNLWIFDDQDFSIKKYNPVTEQVIIHSSLDLILDPNYYDLTYVREYQNLLFIADKNSGILVFDNLGNYKTKFPFTGVSYFNFIGNQMYFIFNKQLVVYDIYTAKQVIVPLPNPGSKDYIFALAGNNRYYFFTKDCVDIYSR